MADTTASSASAQFTPSLSIENGQVTTTSLQISEHFGKGHNLVMRAIRNLECSDEFRLCNFAQSSYINEQGKEQPCYRITRDGFVFLAMGFTGKEAAQWKEAYITAFNRMERELNITAPTPMQPTTLTPSQKQTLHELVDIIAASGKQNHAETWARFHRKFHVNSYHQLPADQFDAACQYLRGKLDGDTIADLVRKHLAPAAALPAPTGIERMIITKDLRTGETTVDTLSAEAVFFRSPQHMARAVQRNELGAALTKDIAASAMMGMVSDTLALHKQTRAAAVTQTLAMLHSLPAADLAELSVQAHLQLTSLAKEAA
jgi:Rha family phage regulatory protein